MATEFNTQVGNKELKAMREILFRGKRLDNGECIDGNIHDNPELLDGGTE